YYQRHFCDAAYAHDGGVRLVDDGQPEDCAELAGVGYGESRTFDVFGFEFFVACAFAQVGDAALQTQEIQIAGVFQDRDDSAPVKRYGDAYIDVSMITNVVAFSGGVDDRELLQGHDRGADEERHHRETNAVTLLESAFLFVAQINDAGEIDFVHAVNVGAGAAR